MIALRPRYPSVAMEIGEGYASAARLARNRGRPSLAEWYNAQLPERAPDEEGLGEHLVLDDRIRPVLTDLADRLGRPRRLSLVMPDTAVRSFFLEIENPARSASELREMIMFKISKLAPIRFEGASLAYQRLRSAGQGGAHYLAQLTSRRMVESYSSFFESGGAHLGLIETSSIATANLFSGQIELLRDGADCAIVRVESGHFSAALLTDGVLTFSRTRLVAPGADPAHLVAQEMRTLSLFAQDKLGSEGIGAVFVHGPGEALDSVVERLGGTGEIKAHALRLADAVELPQNLEGDERGQQSLVGAVGAAARS